FMPHVRYAGSDYFLSGVIVRGKDVFAFGEIVMLLEVKVEELVNLHSSSVSVCVAEKPLSLASFPLFNAQVFDSSVFNYVDHVMCQGFVQSVFVAWSRRGFCSESINFVWRVLYVHRFMPAAVPVNAVFVSVVQRKLVRFPMRNSNVEDRNTVLQL